MKGNTFTVRDYSVLLESLSTEKLVKLLHIATDNVLDLRQELSDVEKYKESIEAILNKRGE